MKARDCNDHEISVGCIVSFSKNGGQTGVGRKVTDIVLRDVVLRGNTKRRRPVPPGALVMLSDNPRGPRKRAHHIKELTLLKLVGPPEWPNIIDFGEQGRIELDDQENIWALPHEVEVLAE